MIKTGAWQDGLERFPTLNLSNQDATATTLYWGGH